MEYLIGLVVALVGGFLYQKSKRETAEARNENLETKEKLNDINKDMSKNSGLLESEESKREELQKELENVNKNETDLSIIANIIDAITKKRR